MPNTKQSLLKDLDHLYDGLGANPIRVFDAEANKIDGVVKLTLGEPDFNVPEHIKQAAIDSINNNESHYGPSNGWPKLRQAATHFLKDRYALDYDPDSELVVTVGATEGLHACLDTLLNPGDKVLMPSPTFSLYDQLIRINGAEPVYINTAATDFVLTPEQLEAALAQEGPRVKAILLNFPSNPTGVTYSKAQVEAIAKVVAKTDIAVISDEIYSELTYGSTHYSFAKALPEQTLLINGVSKSHAMTGWRIGIIAGPAELMKRVMLAHAFDVTVASNPAMAGATEAFATEAGRQDSLAMKAEYIKRRDYVVAEMRDMGFTIPEPTGAFYVFAKIPAGCIQDDQEFCYDLLRKNKLAVIAGGGFGPGGEAHIRVSYAASMATLQEAMKRLRAYVTANQSTHK
ncbi:aminotransferase class I/II-fold pyridoxal phosphate-dependent enzyme [Lacticaseibacillus pabuli]|uniref:Aminotransferase n=1 Tax=Lacticaseibacillus pabuli TaxID=3025672 RepID=A0ABY7WPG8_9LACO|nr:aminotransferase class I/II-fold pyridoxal phosphate-dependent enzyme [Lacticaseibacillus sp. KACC 23028]WDF82093.1 aminotransferase class I/II-fold pyridoxal phosphate-dependent enzyme [Lacticaseibacillus sp. KACC 23028]